MTRPELIKAIDSEISRLQQAKAFLKDCVEPTPTKRRIGRRALSAEARERIAAAQKARWARVKLGNNG
jgi:hypothetical protein